MNLSKSFVRSVLVAFVAGLLFTACIPNRKITLLQKHDINKKHLPKDTIVRTYALDTFQYYLQPNDQLYIQFTSLTNKEFDFFSTGVALPNMGQIQGGGFLGGELIDEYGEITFPVVGKIKVQGLTVFQTQQKLQKLANQYLDSPVVKVRLVNFRITVMGEVVKEGMVTLSNNRVSMIEALGVAGGLGEFADRTNIKLIRQNGHRTEVQYINLLDENFFRSPYYYVHQNDVLIVPPLRQRPFRRYFATNLSLLVSTISLILLTINLTN